MERSEYFTPNATHILLQSFPLTSSGNDVVISVYDINDANLDVNEASMTFVVGESWKYSWSAPNQGNTYLITFHDKNLDVKYFLYARLGTPAVAGAGSNAGSTLTVLQKEFLLSIDEYNADDLSGDGSVGDRATACINQALQKMYSIVKDTRYLAAYPSTAITTTSSQNYIELSGISDLDEVEQVHEVTNDIVLKKLPYWRIREINIDDSTNTGNPTFYSRLFNRLYFSPTPSSALNLTIQYRKLISDLSSGSDQSALPSKFNYWIYAEAHICWQRMQDIGDTASLQNIVAIAEDARTSALEDIRSEFDSIDVSDSNFATGDSDGFHARYNSPVG